MLSTADIEAWFARRGWAPQAFQRQVWQHMAAGESGLLHATTGAGKTLAAWLGALQRAPEPGPGWRVLWLTPMRALAADTARSLRLPLEELAPQWPVVLRTGDTPSSERARQERQRRGALVTTPESLTLMLTREQAAQELGQVQVVVVDEWHELLANKRGVQVQLALARLRHFNPALCVWGLSATLGNLPEALATLLPPRASGHLVQARLAKALVVDTLLPAEPGRFSWAGHLGTQMLKPLVEAVAASGPTLVFTNVRSQAEAWYQMLLNERPDWAGSIALHHGSLDKAAREYVEAELKAGRLKCVVATSSLDLGVDFLPVERVVQIGSAKGIARLLQRAGRSGHQVGRSSRITLVPTHTLELVEAVAARRAALAGQVESRSAPQAPLDVLVQHLVTVALGGGFKEAEMYRELRRTHSYRRLSREAFDWALAFVSHGGLSLTAYPEYHRVQPHEGRWRVTDRAIALRHKLQVGTIVSEASMSVKWLSGGTLGQVEEGFIARLKAGDCFVFAGRVLEYVRTQDMAAYVRKATKVRGAIPAWSGGRMSLSSELADATLQVLAGCAQGDFFEPELAAAQPMLQAQAALSLIPQPGMLLVERWRSPEGHHLYLYPFAGRTAHLGLASLLAWRLAKDVPNTFSMSVNDYGFELLSAEAVDLGALRSKALLAEGELLEDVRASLNHGELAQRRFREIARVAGLVFGGYPGAPKSARQLQASSSLFYEVFRKYDPDNRLLRQADEEVLAQELEFARLRQALQRMRRCSLKFVELSAPSPFCLPLMVERFREEFTTEKLALRLQRILAEAHAELQGGAP